MTKQMKKARKSLDNAEDSNDLSRAYLMQAATHIGWGYEIPEYKAAIGLSEQLDDMINKLKNMVTPIGD